MGRFDKNSPTNRPTFLAMGRSQLRNWGCAASRDWVNIAFLVGRDSRDGISLLRSSYRVVVRRVAPLVTAPKPKAGVLCDSSLTVNDRSDELREAISKENLSITDNW